MGNMSNVQENYTTSAWTIRENYYVGEIAKICIPATPTTRDIMNLISDIDSIVSEAMLDAAYVKRKFEDLSTKMKLAEKETFGIVKQNSTTGVKLTENDVKGLVVQYLKTHPLNGAPITTTNPTGIMKYDIYTLVSGVEHRMYFIEAMVKILQDKKMSIFADKSMLSIEAGIASNVVAQTP